MSGFFLAFFLFGIAFAGESEAQEKLQCIDPLKLKSVANDYEKKIPEAVEDNDENALKDHLVSLLQTGLDIIGSGKFYKLMTKSKCGIEHPPPKKLFFDYDPNPAEKATLRKLRCILTTAAYVKGKGNTCDVKKLKSVIVDSVKKIEEALEYGDEDEVKDFIVDHVKSALDSVGCAYREATRKCGSVAKDSAVLKVFVDMCSTGGAAASHPWCMKLKDLSEDERIVTTKGFFCAFETPYLGTYTKQCFKALLKDKDLKQVVATKKNPPKIQCTGTDYQNQCVTSYLAVKDQCGVDFAEKYYKFMIEIQCGSKPPLTDYPNNTAVNLIPTALYLNLAH